MSNSSKRYSPEDVEKRNSKRTRKEDMQKNEEETSQCFRAMKLPKNLRIWPIFNLLEPEFIPQISSVMVYGRLHNRAIIETKEKNVYNFNCTKHLSHKRIMIKELCGKSIKTFACSNYFILALTEEKEVYYWKFIDKQLDVEEIRFTQVAGLSEKHITKIACGNNHSLALTKDGKVYAWGDNKCGQIGIDNLDFCKDPRQIKEVLGDKIVKHIACGSEFNIVMTDENKIYGWGNNTYNQISIDTHSTSNNVSSQQTIVYIPHEIIILDEIVKLACGNRHTLALSKKGKIYAWGDNDCGQLGVKNEMKSPVPIMVKTPQMKKMSDIAAYGDLSVSVEYENIIYVWGHCGFDQHITIPLYTRFSSIHEPFAYYSRVMHEPLTVCPNIYNDEEELNCILDSLKNAFNKSETSDCTIEVEGQSIYVHKSFLKIRCRSLREIIQHIKNHHTTSSSSSLTTDKFSYTIYKAFFNYLYTATIDIPVKKIIELTKFADMFDETNLKKNCIQIIKQAITVSNAAFFYNQAIKYKVKELEEFCFQFACHHYTGVISSEGYKNLDKNIIIYFTRRAAEEGIFKT